MNDTAIKREKRPVRILIIEDSEDDYLLAHRLLRKYQPAQITWAKRMADALECLDRYPRDTFRVYLDPGLPDVQDALHDAFEALQKYVRPQDIVVVSGGYDDEFIQSVLEAGSGFLRKDKALQVNSSQLARELIRPLNDRLEEELKEAKRQIQQLQQQVSEVRAIASTHSRDIHMLLDDTSGPELQVIRDRITEVATQNLRDREEIRQLLQTIDDRDTGLVRKVQLLDDRHKELRQLLKSLSSEVAEIQAWVKKQADKASIQLKRLDITGQVIVIAATAATTVVLPQLLALLGL